ncbi:glycosyltransferase family 2 protein [Candidatus Wolfebacteria bacterium]|nr:glycosyltransferase family 2 protein [Candidatus Wolfebacteria bacterium]
MRQEPLVSICIPVYNGTRFIRRALDYCINQTYKNIEIVVADDASIDETAAIVKEYEKKDKRIRYFLNEKNMGLGRNFLRSFELASGDFVQHLGCDDWLDENYVKEKVELFKKYPDAAFISCGVILNIKDPKNGEFKEQSRYAARHGIYTKDFTFKNFYRGIDVMGTTAMSRRDDVMENFMATVPNDWGYDDFYYKGKIIDQIGFLNILARYSYFYYTDKVFYNSLDHDAEASKHYGFSKFDVIDQIKFAHIDCVGFEYFYKTKAPSYLSKFRIFKGADILASVVFDLVLKRATGDPRGALKNFFKDYSAKEKICVLTALPFRLIRRCFSWIIKRLR